MDLTLEQVREVYLRDSERKGEELLTKSLKKLSSSDNLDHVANSLPAMFAADTSRYSMDIKEELQEVAKTRIQREAAGIISNEILEEVRRSGLKTLDDGSGDGEYMDLTGLGVDASIRKWDSWMSDFYREFSRVDYLQRGLSEHKMENRDVEEIIKELADTDRWIMEEEDAGELYLNDIHVVDEDWIAYRHGKKPSAYDQEVVDYLRDLGVGKR